MNNSLVDDRLREECGVFGVFGHPDSAQLTVLGLHALQHRGQEAVGIVTFDGTKFQSEKRLGLVGDNFTKQPIIEKLSGISAIGHVRYSTRGETILRNVQPLYADLDTGGFTVGHNGNLTNTLLLREKLVSSGAIFQSTSDTEVILHLVAKSKKLKFIDKFIDALGYLEGAYSLVALTNKKLIGARDPLGIRPLVLGKLDKSYILASETCALDIIGAEFIREVENGEVIVITDDGIESHYPFPKQNPRPCIFEYIYFAMPHSVIGGKSVYKIRKQLGYELSKEDNIKAEIVVPVPDSGVPAALGYSEGSKINFDYGLIRNHYVGRTFIEPTQNIRQFGVRLKHSANVQMVKNRSVVLLDDSLVRGTTSVKIVRMLFESGAKEVHLRIASPPIKYSDYYGIDTPEKDSLLAAKHNIDEMRDYIGCTSLKFLSIEGLYRALGYSERNNEMPQFTDHCFTGDYPTKLSDIEQIPDHTSQLSLLEE
ncbi:MAG: amidophosphoribosyltransferase [Pseudomonadota bacterium]|nr:amidophosphoribosyltransferase [Pseudomonadota bacterium]|tara:strand:+ start:4947 stop:6392 length:1446 start_codon:yes stop_codon:yes gene_type:complete